MRSNRELNIKIANEVFGYSVGKSKGVWTEFRPQGDRPLRNYSGEMEWAWEVAEKMKITVIPVIDGQWFAFVELSQSQNGWKSPQAVFEFLEAGNFNQAGASVQPHAALAICEAALKSLEKQKLQKSDSTAPEVPSASPIPEAVEAPSLH